MSYSGPLGYLVPEEGDRGDELLRAIRILIDKVARHDHSGTDSVPLSLASTTNAERIYTEGGSPALTWSAARDSEGLYSAVLALPSGQTTNARTISFFENVTSDPVVPGEKRRAYLDFRVVEPTADSATTSLTVYSNVKLPVLTVKLA